MRFQVCQKVILHAINDHNVYFILLVLFRNFVLNVWHSNIHEIKVNCTAYKSYLPLLYYELYMDRININDKITVFDYENISTGHKLTLPITKFHSYTLNFGNFDKLHSMLRIDIRYSIALENINHYLLNI